MIPKIFNLATMHTILKVIWVTLVLIFCFEISAQDKAELDQRVDLLIDSLWDLQVTESESFNSLSNELIKIGEQHNHHKAKVNGYQGMGEFYIRKNNFDIAFTQYLKANEIAKSANDRREEGHTLISLALIERYRNNTDEFKSYFLKGISTWTELKDTNQICYSYLQFGQALSVVDEHSEAINQFLNGCENCLAANNKSNYAACLSGMSIVHKKQKNLAKAIELSEESLRITREINDDWSNSTELNNLGILYKDIGNYTRARELYDEGLEIAKGFNYPPLEMSFMVNKGILNNLENKPRAALDNLNQAYPISIEIKNLVSTSDILNEISKSYLSLKEYSVAADTIKNAIKYAQQSHSLEKEWQAWNTQFNIYKAMGKNDLAIQSLEQYQVMQDSIYQIEKTAEIDRLQTEFETERKEQEIQHLESEALLDASRKKWLGLGIIGLFLAAIAIIYSIAVKRRKDKKLHQTAIELKDSENQRLEETLNHKKKELTEKALHLAQKNELLSSLKSDLKSISTEENESDVKAISNKIRFDEQMNQNWEQFLIAFKESKQGFFKNLSSLHPEVGKSDLRLSALLSMNLGSKEIASILNISDMGVKKARYRSVSYTHLTLPTKA